MGQACCNSIRLREQSASKSHPLPLSTLPGNGHLDLYAKSAAPSPPLCCPFILASPRAQERKGGKKESMPLLHGHLPPALQLVLPGDRWVPLHQFLQPLRSIPERNWVNAFSVLSLKHSVWFSLQTHHSTLDRAVVYLRLHCRRKAGKASLVCCSL